jgi:V8-like Glu-specific endopeptidase
MRWFMVSVVGLTISAAVGQNTAPLVQLRVPYQLDSGPVVNGGVATSVAFTEQVQVPDALWLRLEFSEVILGVDPLTGEEATLRITSLLDGASQTHTSATLAQWNQTTAYFNGDAVTVELIVGPNSTPSQVILDAVLVGPAQGGGIASQCGPTDDRVPSADDRAARILPIGCTGWLINDASNCFLTAGHCSGGLDVLQFNVPFSSAGGALQHPGPEDQYTVDATSTQSVAGGIGNDWAYFGCFPNTETGLTAGDAQGITYVLAAAAPPVTGQKIEITGYGVDSTPSEWNQIQQTHAGPYAILNGNQIGYQTDTEGGNSGSATVDVSTGLAIGIHTNGGCSSGFNSGTAIHNGGLQNALANPQGICLTPPLLTFGFPDGLPEIIDPAGDTIRVEISGANGGTPQSATGILYYDTGGGLISIPMSEVSANVYDAVFPAIACTTNVNYYFSAETSSAETVNDPFVAPNQLYTTLATVALVVAFADDFESNLGWVVSNDAGLVDGQWQRAVPLTLAVCNRGNPGTDADGSGQCYITDNSAANACNSDVDGGTTTLTSPVMDASDPDAVISYWRWYSNTFGDSPMADIFVVEISDDSGANWVNLETVGPVGAEVGGGWFRREYVVADIAGIVNSTQLRVRFLASDLGAGSVVEAGVDGVEVFTYVCDDAVFGDLDDDGIVGINDFLILLAEWGPCDQPCPPSCPADLDEDCTVGINDFLLVLANWT